MTDGKDIGQWVHTVGTNAAAVGVLEDVRPTDGLVCWGVHNHTRYETWVPLEDLGIIPGRDPEQVALTITRALDRAGRIVPPDEGGGPSPGAAWCSQHRCEPHDCWAQHNPPWAISGREPNWAGPDER